MMYKNDFVASIKVAGKILREHNTSASPTVYLPFSSEFSILLKNLKSRKASVKISIDGKDVLNGGSIILNGNESLELERFLTDLNVGNKFKFIEKTQEISDFRGDKVDDGIVRIEYRFEKEPEPMNWYNAPLLRSSHFGDNTVYGSKSMNCDTMDGLHSRRINVGSPITQCFNTSIFNCSSDATAVASASCGEAYNSAVLTTTNTDGITVAGSESKQKFVEGNIGALEYQSHVITLQLKGGTYVEPVTQVITVNTKVQCPTCGRMNKTSNKFCSNCGTAVKII